MNNSLIYCIRIVYKDGTIWTDQGKSIDPEGLMFFIDDGEYFTDTNPPPVFNNHDEMLTLIYNKLDEYDLKKNEVKEIQIYRTDTNEVYHSKTFDC